MALKKSAVIRGVTDGAFKPAGGTKTDIKGISAIKLDYDMVSAQSEGDDKVYSVSSKTKTLKLTFEHAILDLNTISGLTGYTVTAGGTGADETQTLDIDSDQYPYFSFECRSTNIIDTFGAGDSIVDAHLKVYKAKITGGLNIEVKDEGHWQVSFEAIAIPDVDNSDKIASIIFYEKSTDISL